MAWNPTGLGTHFLLAQQKLLLSPGVRLVDFWSPGTVSNTYHKIHIISPGLIFFSGLILQGAYYWNEVSKWVGLAKKGLGLLKKKTA